MKNKAGLFSKSQLFLGLIILFVVFVRVRLLEFPLERDEGEYAYMGQLILQGIPPYSEAYNMKFPGTYLMYALIMSVFSQTIQGIHLGLLAVNCASIILIFYLAKKMMGDLGAVIAGGTYAVLSLSYSVLGFAGHATHFVVLPALGGTLLLMHALEKEKTGLYFFSGVLFGMSVIMKQPGIFFVLFGATYIVFHHVSSRLSGLQADQPISSQSDNLAGALTAKFGAFSIGASLPLLITFVWLYASGVFGKFWFWTMEYASKYGSQVPLSEAFSVFMGNFEGVTEGSFLLWVIGALGFLMTLFRRDFQDKVFVVLFALFSFLTVCPGFYFRNHYFVTFLPALSLLVGIFFDYLVKKGTVLMQSRYVKIAASGIFLVVTIVGVKDHRGYFFKDDPVRIARIIYRGNPFPESIEIAKFIEANSSATDRIAVLGSEPQIYFYSGRRSATGYIYTYGLMEIHDYSLRMQKEMISEIESSRPKFIVVVSLLSSWMTQPNSEKLIFGWADDYLSKNYSLVGVADMVSPDMTIYKWHGDASNYAVRSDEHLLVYERI